MMWQTVLRIVSICLLRAVWDHHTEQVTVHSQGVIHGDLTTCNVLINDEGSACITDFGLSIVQAEFQGTSFITVRTHIACQLRFILIKLQSMVGGAIRFRAPELLPTTDTSLKDKFTAVLTFQCDVYSLGSVFLEVRL